jgi:hypothetical protein
LRHIGRADREGTRIHGQAPSSVLLTQSGVHGWVTSGQQACQAGYPQVTGGSLVTPDSTVVSELEQDLAAYYSGSRYAPT